MGALLKCWGGLEVHTQTGFEPPAGLQPGVRRRLPDYGGPDPERTLHTWGNGSPHLPVEGAGTPEDHSGVGNSSRSGRDDGARAWQPTHR